MTKDDSGALIRAGDADGLGRVYSEFGGPILQAEETILAHRQGCDVAAYGSWRMFFARRIFHPLPGTPSGIVHLTSNRLIFTRSIDVWKEVKPLLTPLGLPVAADKEARLKALRAKGVLQYCEVFYSRLTLIRAKRKPGLLYLRLMTTDSQKYELFVYTDRDDPGFFDLIERRLQASSDRRS